MLFEEIKPIPLEATPRSSLPNFTVTDHYAIYATFGADPWQYGEPDVDENRNTYYETFFPDSTATLIADSQPPPPPGHTAKLRVYAAVKRTVIERSDDTLTQNEPAKQ